MRPSFDKNISFKIKTIYADDTSLIVSAPSKQLALDLCNSTIESLSNSLAFHCLKLNGSKTCFIEFNKDPNTPIPQGIVVGSDLIGSEQTFKFLGVHIDADLSWRPHVTNLLNKLNASLFVIKKLAKLESKSLALLAYYATFESHLAYGIEVWGASSVTQLEQILKIQKKAIRGILNLGKYTSCRPYFQSLKILTIAGLYAFRILLYAKSLHDERKLVQARERHDHHTRGGTQISHIYRRTTKFSNSPCLMAVSFFNLIPVAMRVWSMRHFKKWARDYFASHAYYTLDEVREGLRNMVVPS